MGEPQIAIITNCTSRKRGAAKGRLRVEHSQRLSLETIASNWVSRTDRRDAAFRAGDYYLGRAFSEARRSAECAGARLLIVSAGLGLIHSDHTIPPYDLTVSGGASSIAPLLLSKKASPSDWWEALSKAKGQLHPLAAFLSSFKSGIVLLALPSTYLEMVAEDLKAIPSRSADRLRIFTSPRGMQLIPKTLERSAIRYDERLEGSSFSGTQSDFAQRALCHYVCELKGHMAPLDGSKAAVTASLSKFKRRTIPKRVKKTDSEIAALLRKQWRKHDGKSSSLLRYLRDEAKVACEQSRFRDIWRSLEMKNAA